ncbi:hypothetical protein TruAng_011183 [Truncatella angustata]|nr:hypothetical protein TruAng_011183 [Truncatella angustata]
MLDSSGPQSTSSHGSGSEDSVTSLMARGGGGLETGGSTDTPSVKKSARIQDVLRSELGTAQDENRKRKGVSIGQGSPEIIDSLLVVNQYKERLARDIACRELAARPPHSAAGKKRVSPIQERLPLSPSSGSASSSDIPTASIESNKTGRGGSTTAFTPGLAGRTPSYSFLRMATPGHGPSALRGTFTHGTPGGIFNAAGAQCDSVIHDQLRSDPFTPAPIMTFQPRGSSPLMDRDFPTPNLYELVLMLGAEPGLDAWWCTVVQIMKEHYRAERVTLSVSADATDLESVPWAQKATYNPTEEDEYSMGYMGRSSMFLSSMDVSETASNLDGSQRSDMPLRPGTQSHHYFTSYENKESTAAQSTESPSTTPQRPTAVPRSNSSFPAGEKRVPSSPRPSLNKQALEEHDAVEQRQPILSWGAPVGSRPKAKGRVLPVLQELELEADPLIDHNGIKGVIERDRVIALTRSYPYLDPAFDEKSKKKSNRPNPTRIHSSAKLSSFLATATDARPPSQSTTATGGDRISKRSNLLTVLDDEEPRPPTRKYEEYKQAPPSPWSQFPTHSPTVQVDPSEIPFFTDAMVDEDSFNPGRSPIDYTNSQPPKTIGVDNSWTVLHIPFKHILLSKPARTFNLKSAALAQKTASRGLADTTAVWGFSEPPSRSDLLEDSRHYPIAILSILSPLIPYPSNLRYSLEHLASHLATSFSLPATAGFGALGPDGRPLAGPVLYAQMKYTPSEHPWQQSIAGSMTSPSEASGATRSAAHSPGGSIEWDPNSFGLAVENRTRSKSLGMVGGDGYFAAAAQSVATSQDGTPDTAGYRPGRGPKETPPSLKRPCRQTGSGQSIQPSTPAVVDFASALHIPHERTLHYPAKEQAALKEIGQA